MIKMLILAIIFAATPLFVGANDEVTPHLVTDETFDFPADVKEACYRNIPKGGKIFGVGYYKNGLMEVLILYPDGSAFMQMCNYLGEMELLAL